MSLSICSFLKKMNSTFYTLSLTFIDNSSTTNFESWFIPLDILSIICTDILIGLTALFLFIIILNKTCHTISMMLIIDSCLIAFALEVIPFILAITIDSDTDHLYNMDRCFLISICIYFHLWNHLQCPTLYNAYIIKKKLLHDYFQPSILFFFFIRTL